MPLTHEHDCRPCLVEDYKLTPEAKAKVKAIIEVLKGLDFDSAIFILASVRKGLHSAAIVYPEKLHLESAEGIY